MGIVKTGSIFLDGAVQSPGFVCNEFTDISFGNTVPCQELQWVKLKNGLLIADRCVCKNISWNQLDEKGLVFGTPITIDGNTYFCRCLKVGTEEDEPNEWDAALDEVGEDNTLWHWKKNLFWGQETSKYVASARAVRGWVSARHWHCLDATGRSVYVGFRPALEYLGSESCSPDTLIGRTIKAYCPGGVTIEGRLIDFSDYDIVLKSISSLPADCPWAVKEGHNVIVNRENLSWLKEV